MFPTEKHASVESYATDYFDNLQKAYQTIDFKKLGEAAALLVDCYRRGGKVFTCGNGGSAAISNHFVCDHMKGIRAETCLKPRVVSLSSNIETITAIANDSSYDDIFIHQLSSLAQDGDVLLTISSSGDSPNIVNAIEWAKENQVKVIAISGFSGGRSRKISDVSLHVDADNYGIVEDSHQSLMHILAQFIRQSEMADEKIEKTKF